MRNWLRRECRRQSGELLLCRAESRREFFFEAIDIGWNWQAIAALCLDCDELVQGHKSEPVNIHHIAPLRIHGSLGFDP